jgi:hypothetical protein
MIIPALTRNQVADIGLSGNAEITDMLTRVNYVIRISVSRNYHHSDFQPRSRADAEAMLRASGGKWSWEPRPVIMRWGKNTTVGAIHSYPHSINLFGQWAFDITSDSILRNAGVSGNNGGWAVGSHFCLHYIDSIRIREVEHRNPPTDWWRRMFNAANHAFELANATTNTVSNTVNDKNNERTVIAKGEDIMLMELIRQQPGCKDVTINDVASLLGYQVAQMNRGVHTSIAKDLELATEWKITNGTNPGLPVTRAEAAVMALRASSNIKDCAPIIK